MTIRIKTYIEWRMQFSMRDTEAAKNSYAGYVQRMTVYRDAEETIQKDSLLDKAAEYLFYTLPAVIFALVILAAMIYNNA